MLSLKEQRPRIGRFVARQSQGPAHAQLLALIAPWESLVRPPNGLVLNKCLGVSPVYKARKLRKRALNPKVWANGENRQVVLYGAALKPDATLPSPTALAELSELVVARGAAKEEQTAQSNRQGAAESKWARQATRRRSGVARNAARLAGRVKGEPLVPDFSKEAWRQEAVSRRGRIGARNEPKVKAGPQEFVELGQNDP
jgi:hypothetical protein